MTLGGHNYSLFVAQVASLHPSRAESTKVLTWKMED